jgi:hypothetical protein
MRVEIVGADGAVRTLEQSDGEPDDKFHERVGIVVALLAEESKVESSAISVIRKAIEPS